jgi:hypothetical protein
MHNANLIGDGESFMLVMGHDQRRHTFKFEDFANLTSEPFS